MGLVLTALILLRDVAGEANQVERLRDGCERQNVRTVGLFEKYLADERESRAFSELSTGEEARVTMRAAEDYEDAARELVDLVKDDGLQLERGSPATDCAEAFPHPIPVRFFIS